MSFKKAIIRMKATVKPRMNSGESFGPFASVSKKRIIPIEELGPETAGPCPNFTIFYHTKI